MIILSTLGSLMCGCSIIWLAHSIVHLSFATSILFAILFDVSYIIALIKGSLRNYHWSN